ncbi:hypothetical protein ElyMa_004651600 [Elysia marginata]|uniref:Uncharacterized protein n=1 Tax=Elysia marginata TaxID=1093978 RepID=A0AAV4I174_9GAST|nr:hypothetical protein ElyMa_004651600 [Elysia marginata]
MPPPDLANSTDVVSNQSRALTLPGSEHATVTLLHRTGHDLGNRTARIGQSKSEVEEVSELTCLAPRVNEPEVGLSGCDKTASKVLVFLLFLYILN